ncbi:unnamed protein product [Cylicocyclus nassatus]|uniref:NNMT/PNMT/TEMT family protein n=1 Tax=Cylicocyclus nassatus TaxID=53992 RepID=A0AA36GR62_CYLNA|nr:unnamed protein product [Cylicocyclus nassatus]
MWSQSNRLVYKGNKKVTADRLTRFCKMTINGGDDSNDPEAKSDEEDEVCPAVAHKDKFDPRAYLESFYKEPSEDTAMQIVLFFLPGILYRLPRQIRTVLDLGAGPTVYLPIALRNQAQEMYTSDYAPANREFLKKWIENESAFDWTNVCHWISNIEASDDEPAVMQQKAREKMNAVLEVNVHKMPVVQGVHWQRKGTTVPEKFQLVSTVFCLEYSCETLEGYKEAVQGACGLIEDGGYLMQGGVMDSTTYNFGGKCFKCHRLKRSHVEEALKENGMATKEADGYKFITHEDIFLLISRKIK